MRYFILFMLSFFMMSVSMTSMALAQSNDVSVSQEKLNSLIKTLESETARNEFLNNLKALNDVDADGNPQTDGDTETTLPIISQTFGVEDTTSKFIAQYEKFLADNNLNENTVGKVGLTAIAMIVAFIVLFIIQKMGALLRRYILKLQEKHDICHQRFRLYSRVLRYIAYTGAIALLVYTLNIIWELADLSFLQGDAFGAFMGNLVSLALIAIIAIIFWELANLVLDKVLKQTTDLNSSRMQTVLPILRNVLFITFSILFTLVLLSELGIDIMPLLAGAGVLGIAIGFGAQTMVKDFLTGFTVILEDLIQVGDVATLAGKTGFIERITIRKVQLRQLDGTVVTVPFGEVSVVENLTKEFSFYLLDVGVAYRENTDEVIEYLREIDEEMRSDENFKNLIMAPIEILGVDQFADSAVIIKARLKTKPVRQWDVGREFNRRMKFKFDEKGVEIPFPHQTIYFGEDKKGNAPSGPIRLIEDDSDGETKKSKSDNQKKAKSPQDQGNIDD